MKFDIDVRGLRKSCGLRNIVYVLSNEKEASSVVVSIDCIWLRFLLFSRNVCTPLFLQIVSSDLYLY